MLQLKSRHLEIVRQILAKYPYHFYVYGSRAKGQAEEYSDLDICYREPISWKTISNIYGELEESDLPFKVDLIFWGWMSPEFQKLISQDLVLFK